eukprot:3686483-Amphidinium_carterae.1
MRTITAKIDFLQQQILQVQSQASNNLQLVYAVVADMQHIWERVLTEAASPGENTTPRLQV